MSDVFVDVREARERVVAAEAALLVEGGLFPHGPVRRALVELRKAINVLDEWVEE